VGEPAVPSLSRDAVNAVRQQTGETFSSGTGQVVVGEVGGDRRIGEWCKRCIDRRVRIEAVRIHCVEHVRTGTHTGTQ